MMQVQVYLYPRTRRTSGNDRGLIRVDPAIGDHWTGSLQHALVITIGSAFNLPFAAHRAA